MHQHHSRLILHSCSAVSSPEDGRHLPDTEAGGHQNQAVCTLQLQGVVKLIQAPSDSGKGAVAACSWRWKEGEGARNKHLPSTHKGQLEAPNEALQGIDCAGCCQTRTSTCKVQAAAEEGRLGMQQFFT